eukprot:10229617-Alexandrium_andersonii.AAC.1
MCIRDRASTFSSADRLIVLLFTLPAFNALQLAEVDLRASPEDPPEKHLKHMEIQLKHSLKIISVPKFNENTREI